MGVLGQSNMMVQDSAPPHITTHTNANCKSTAIPFSTRGTFLPHPFYVFFSGY